MFKLNWGANVKETLTAQTTEVKTQIKSLRLNIKIILNSQY
jgi:hypothetical protein